MAKIVRGNENPTPMGVVSYLLSRWYVLQWQAQSVEFEAIRCVIRAMPEGATVFMSQCDGGVS